MKKLKKKLEKEGLTVWNATCYNYKNTGKYVPCLIVDTDYEGPFAPKETFNKVDIIRKVLNKDKSEWEMETHQSNVCVKIYPSLKAIQAAKV